MFFENKCVLQKMLVNPSHVYGWTTGRRRFLTTCHFFVNACFNQENNDNCQNIMIITQDFTIFAKFPYSDKHQAKYNAPACSPSLYQIFRLCDSSRFNAYPEKCLWCENPPAPSRFTRFSIFCISSFQCISGKAYGVRTGSSILTWRDGSIRPNRKAR